MIDDKEYYKALYEKTPDAWVMLSAFKPNKNFPVRVQNLADEIAKRSVETSQSLYATYAVFNEPPSDGRGDSDDISAIYGVFLDIDIAEVGTYAEKKNAPLTLDGLKAKARGWGLPEPSAIVNSGRGLHFDFWLHEPLVLRSDKDRARAKKFLKEFNAYAIEKAALDGIKLDNMGDLARVKRAVGSVNYRPGEAPKPVVVIELNPERRYSLEALEQYKPAEFHGSREIAVINKTTAKAGGPSWDQIVANDPFVQHCILHATELSYPYWFAALGIAARCENGRDVAHEFSRIDARRYSTKETDEKIDEVLKASGAVTYKFIAQDLGFGEALDDHIAARLHSPLDFGRLDPELLRLVKGNVYDLASTRFYDLETLTPVSKEAFAMQHGHRLQNPVMSFKASDLAVKARRADYLPGERRLVGKDENPVLNLYREPDLKAVEGDCSRIVGHFNYLIPDADDREYVLNYLSHMRLHPGVKINTGLLFVGPQGNGKSFVIRILKPILGASNVKTLGVDVIGNRFQADRTNIQLLVIEELMGIDRAGSNSLKEWLTADTIHVEEKGTPRYEAKTPRGMIFTSNHIDAVALERSERRIAAIQTAETRESDDYFSSLSDALDSELPAFAWWLERRGVGAFNPHAPAPQTALKTEMQKLSLSPLETEIYEAMDGREGIFAQDIGTLEQVLQDLLSERGWSGAMPTKASVGAVLTKLGAKSIGQKRLRDKGKPRLWAFRDAERWNEASNDDLYTEYQPRKIFITTGNIVPLRQTTA